ncbi:MAG TPA: methyltransferase domain-containing protein [Methanosarcinaceae archaeon]|nr:methyltransferase domain-containing protein [Methanosarcinaceae archaeon]
MTHTKAQVQFAKRSRAYAKSSALSNKDNLKRIIELTAPSGTDHLLDVATGTGFLAFEFANHVSCVTGIDFTGEMLAIANQYKADNDIENVVFESADVESLPFGDGSFDLVSCRFALHHFLHPEKAISEIARVLKHDGKVVISDITSPEDIAKSEYQNEMEQIRDPSHVKHYRPSEIVQMLTDRDFEILHFDNWPADFAFDEWVLMSGPGVESIKRIRDMMKNAMKNNLTDQDIRLNDAGDIWFTYNTKIIVARNG